MSAELADATEIHGKYPDTFWIPSPKTLAALKAGDYVKLIFVNQPHSERMWVGIVTRDGDSFTGVLMDEPCELTSIKEGDTVSFQTRHIIDHHRRRG